MLKICRNNREEIENEFMSLVLNKNDVIDLLQIKPKYLLSKDNQKLLEYAIECYKNIKVVSPVEIYKLHKDFNQELYVELLTETLYFPNSWKEQLDLAQESILKYFKEDYISSLNEQLKNKKIEYDFFMQRMKEVDNVQLLENAIELKKDEILNCINEEKSRINLNKFPKLNNILKMVQGDFVVIGATTGAGKSGLMINLMEDLMTGYQCIYFNIEMSKATIYKRIVSINSNVKINDVEKPQSEYQKELVEKSLNKIEEAKLIIEHKVNDMTGIKATISKMKDKNKHTIVFIDHLGLVKIDGMKSLYEQATEVAKELRQICLEFDCTIISASQLNRGAYASDEITLNMLKDSGELENSASKVILLYKDKNSKKEDLMQDMIFDVAKNRDGYTGLINATYDKEKQIFIEKRDY